MGTLVMDMVLIEHCEQDIDVEQRSHGLELVLGKLVDHLGGEDCSRLGQYREAIPDAE
jgi:hypothetical protein